MEIQPASVAQIRRSRSGKLVEISDDVGGVARDLRAIDPHLCLRFSDSGDYFVVYWKPDGGEDGDGYLVLTAQECDQRIVARVRQIQDPSYDYLAELDRLETENRRKREHEWSEYIGDVGERLAHALRKDRGYDQQRIYIPGRPAA